MTFPFKVVDLTHTLSPEIPTWNGACGFTHQLESDYEDSDGDVQFRVQSLAMRAGIGTHLDAPAHCFPSGLSVDQMDLQKLIVPCVVIDISDRAHERYKLMVQDIEEFEKIHGHIVAGCFVVVRTGWERFWGEPEKYHNNHVFPSVSIEAAQLLLQRQVVGLGIDTLSPDRPEDGYPVHGALLGAGKYIVENVACSEKLPPVGSYSCALPIKIKHGTEAPIRLIGLVP